jgi:uncharacterized protein YkwD
MVRWLQRSNSRLREECEEPMRRSVVVLLSSLLVALALLFASVSVPTARAAAATVYPTGYSVSPAFQTFFAANGGVEIFGYPLTGEVAEGGYTVQYFERSRFEFHPEFAGTANEVLLSRLGLDQTAGRAFPSATDVPDANQADFFSQTNHTLRGAFRAYWYSHNGVRLFGYPLSEELSERSVDDGQWYTVQYFERARMEWHSETGLVLLGRLGAQAFTQAYAAQPPVPAGSSASTPAQSLPQLDGYEQQTLAVLMAARSAAGLPLPQLDSALVGLARERSADMATRNYFSHVTPEGTNIFTMLNAAGLPWNVAGETIARNNYANNETAGVAGQALLNSPPHRAVILDPQYNYVGIGHAVDGNGMHYYTVVFVRR